MRSEEELAELTKMAQQLEEELDRWTMIELDRSDDQLLARTREELGATTHQLAEKEGFDLKYFYNKKKVRQCAEWYISTNEIKGASSSSRGAWGLVSHEEGSGGFSLVGNILPTHLSFKTRCWKRTWRAQRTGFYWPARWCCSCFGGGMNGDGQECFRVLITSFWGEDSAGKNYDGDERLMFDLPRNWIRLRLQWTTVTGWER